MTVFGVWRCSTDIQDQERQVIALEKAGAEKIYDWLNNETEPKLTNLTKNFDQCN